MVNVAHARGALDTKAEETADRERGPSTRRRALPPPAPFETALRASIRHGSRTVRGVRLVDRRVRERADMTVRRLPVGGIRLP